MSTPAVLALEDGTVFRGVSVGAKGNTTGEVVFNTAMTGLSGDPHRSLLLPADRHSHVSAHRQHRHHARGSRIRRGLRRGTRHPRSAAAAFELARHRIAAAASCTRCKVVAIADIDTRKLTRLLREKGAQAGCIMTGEQHR